MISVGIFSFDLVYYCRDIFVSYFKKNFGEMAFKSKISAKRAKTRVAVIKFHFIKISNWFEDKMLLIKLILKSRKL